jgi:hypothetical protein
MRGILDAASKLVVLTASWGASAGTSVETSSISPPTSTAGADIMGAEERPARVELEKMPSRDGVCDSMSGRAHRR